MSLTNRLAATAAVTVAAASLVAASPATSQAVTPISGGLVGHHLLAHGGSTKKSGAESSYNWAGYAKEGTYKSASATWTVPTTLTTKAGYASTWVGLDGYADSYLTQTGIEEDVVNGKVTYDAWWEIITPSDEAPETLFSGFKIKPGDSITGTVAITGTKTTLTLVDTTTGKTATHTGSYKGPGDSAEWIQEDTDVNGYISAAPDWQKVTFSGAKIDGAAAGLTSGESIDIVDTLGTQETSTSAPNSTGDGFTVSWLATGTKTRA